MDLALSLRAVGLLEDVTRSDGEDNSSEEYLGYGEERMAGTARLFLSPLESVPLHGKNKNMAKHPAQEKARPLLLGAHAAIRQPK
jgi:hypothetical protein